MKSYKINKQNKKLKLLFRVLKQIKKQKLAFRKDLKK